MSHPHLALNPTVVRLSDLPVEGRKFVYTQTSGELTSFIKELVGQNPYRIELEIKPLGNVYSAQGRITTGMDELCSLCAYEFILPVKESFNEILIIRDSPDRHDHQVRVNHSSELDQDGPECTELESEEFFIGDFIRELIAVTRPVKPVAGPDCEKGTCENYQEAVRKGWLNKQDDGGFQSQKPFSNLGRLLNK